MVILKLKDVLKASVCAFGRNIFDYFSLDEEDFIKELEYCISKNVFNEVLDEYACKLEYDIVDIDNICDNYKGKHKEWNYTTVITCCKKAYIETITRDKTIDAQAFVDNIVKELK